jgi:hypothetical protein
MFTRKSLRLVCGGVADDEELDRAVKNTNTVRSAPDSWLGQTDTAQE